MPQLDIATFPTQIIWLFLTFIPLFIIVWKVAVPRISDSLELRQKRIEDNLEKTAQFKKEAEEAHQAYENSLSDAREAAALTISEALKKLEEEVALRELETSIRLNEMIAESEKKIQDAVTKALVNIHEAGEDVAFSATEFLLGEAALKSDISQAVDETMEKNISISGLTITREQV